LTYVSAASRRTPDWVDAAICKAVGIAPAKRYDTPSAFAADLRRANPAFATTRFQPLAERDPVRFWQTVSALLALLVLVLLAA